MTITDLLTEYGAYYEKAGQNRNRVLSKLLLPSVTESYMTPIRTDETIYRLANATIASILQPFQKSWTPKTALTVTPNELRLREFKVDEEVYPDDIEASWLGFLASQNVDRKTWPLIRWMIEEYYIPKIKDDYEVYEVFKGEYSAPGAGVAGAAGTAMDGLKKQLTDGIAAGTINEVSLSALTTSNIFDQVEAFDDEITGAYRGKPMNIFMSESWARAYRRDKRNEFGYDAGANDLSGAVDFTPRKVVGLPSMEGEDIIFATPKENLLSIRKKSANQNRFQVEGLKRQVFFYTDFWAAVGFGINEAVWAYVPAESASGSAS